MIKILVYQKCRTNIQNVLLHDEKTVASVAYYKCYDDDEYNCARRRQEKQVSFTFGEQSSRL